MAARAAALLVPWLLALAACQDDMVELEIQVPGDVDYDRIRVVKTVDGNETKEVSQPTMATMPGKTSIHWAGIFVPRGAKNAVVLVQAIKQDLVNAQAERNLVAPVVEHATIPLNVCTPPFRFDGAGACGKPAPYVPPVVSCTLPDMTVEPPRSIRLRPIRPSVSTIVTWSKAAAWASTRPVRCAYTPASSSAGP